MAGPSPVQPVPVAVGVLARRGRILIAERPRGRHLAGYWEFPGGKLRASESPRAALERELREEIGIAVRQARPLIRTRHRYHDRLVELQAWLVEGWDGEPRPREGQRLRWVPREALARCNLPPADRPILRALSLPPAYLITPEPPAGRAAGERFLARLEAALGRGVTLVQLRAKSLDGRALEAMVEAALERCAGAGAELLVNAPAGYPSGSRRLQRSGREPGVHLSAARLAALPRRPPTGGLVGASCHDAAELARAERVADFAVLGPVKPTRTHPGAPATGWARFESLVSPVSIPVYALGGMRLSDLGEAWRRGGQGVAAIRSLWCGDDT